MDVHVFSLTKPSNVMLTVGNSGAGLVSIAGKLERSSLLSWIELSMT